MIFIMFQFACFLDTPVLKADRFAGILNEKCGNAFDETRFVVPFPDNAPNEVVQASYGNSEKMFTLNIARSRVDMFIGSNGEEYAFEGMLHEFRTVVLPYFECISGLQSVGRIGMVGQFFDSNKDPFVHLPKKFLKKKPYSELIDIGLRFGKREMYSGVQVNMIANVMSANMQSNVDPVKKLGVHVQLDINTDAERSSTDSATLHNVAKKYVNCFSIKEIERLYI